MTCIRSGFNSHKAMKAIFIEQTSTEFSRSYHILNETTNDDIGVVEGYVNRYGELISVVKIFDSKFQKRGLGFLAFKKAFDELNSVIPILRIKGSWHRDEEFQNFEEGMSTNLRIFLNCIKTSKDHSFCALQTPTGRWARKLGFKDCNVLFVSSDEVSVEFIKRMI